MEEAVGAAAGVGAVAGGVCGGGSAIAEASVLGHLTVITAAFREKRVWSEKKNGSTGTGNGTVTQVPTKPAEHPKKNQQKEREARGREAEGKRER